MTDEKIQQKIDQFARKSGYAGADYLCDWQGYACYAPYIKQDEKTVLALPQLILERGGFIRMSTADEAMQIG